jgi:hypothetical protein
MIPKGNRNNDSGDQEVQLSYLLFKVQDLLEVARQHFYSQGANSEPVRQIERALGSIKSLPNQSDKN